jgi:hypothetical protein
MKTSFAVWAGAGVLLSCTGSVVRPAVAGTQDFVLVNRTGVTINNLHISETKKDDWEEDVLGDEVLEEGESLRIGFEGKAACDWDLMVKDDDGDATYWRQIDLCEVSKITLRCNKKSCPAETE